MTIASYISGLLGAGARYIANQAGAATAGPETPSADYAAMAPTWCKIADILDGAECIRAAGPRYLPRFPKEGLQAYELRRRHAAWRPAFEDALRSLCSKPFGKPVTLQGAVRPEIELFADDVDGQGNNLHVFAKNVFQDAVAKGVSAILIDYPKMPNVMNGRPLSIADEKAIGARPYWIHIQAENILAYFTEYRFGREIVTQVRIRECTTVRDGFAERTVERIRVIEPGKWGLYERPANGGEFEIIDSGPVSLPYVPLVMIFIGERTGTYRVKPPLKGLADLQLELYRAHDRYNYILDNASSPMLVGRGVTPPEQRKDIDGDVRIDDAIEVGPKSVLFAPMNSDGQMGDWKYIAPPADAIGEVRQNVEGVTEDFNALAMQPTTPKSGDITATATSVDAAKAHSAVEAWAKMFNDRLNQALKFTAAWMNIPDTTTCSVFTDFAGDANGVDEARVLADATKRGTISQKAERAELQRRNILGPDYDSEADEMQIAAEQQGLEPEQPIDPITGQPIDPANENLEAA